MNLVYLHTDNENVKKAYYTALSDVISNIKPIHSGEAPILMAGSEYVAAWTRDTAINVSNAAGFLFPDISRNTLMSVINEVEGKRIPGVLYHQHWDAVIWILGAWQYYIYTSDREFLKTAYSICLDTLAYYEEKAWDEKMELFRGPAVYGDGVSAYSDCYAKNPNNSAIILCEGCDQREYGGTRIRMYTLSTNCVYARAYAVADLMAEELGLEKKFVGRFDRLKASINEKLWLENEGHYRYFLDANGGSDRFEALGQSFAILFGIANEKQIERILQTQPITNYGIACVYPSFERYLTPDGKGYGRHSGTVWGHIQGIWADAALRYGGETQFLKEFRTQTSFAIRDGMFAEVYHPDTGALYGGRQERRGKGCIDEWVSTLKQTWTATGYLRMIFMDIAGMRFEKDRICFAPYLPDDIKEFHLSNLFVRGYEWNIKITGIGANIKHFFVNGAESEPTVLYDDVKKKMIEIELTK